jgi:hypothetical protein
MNWEQFLKYSKYIAIFYAIAFCIGIIGIWVPPHGQWLTMGAFFCAAALAGNVALAFYHSNHKGSMIQSKNEYLVQQDEAQVITGESTGTTMELATPSEARKRVVADMDEHIRQVVRDERYR